MQEDKHLKKLIKIISDGEKNLIDMDHFKKWNEFKKEWSNEDKTYWESLLKKVSKNDEGRRILNTPLSCEEKAWIMKLLNRAIDLDIF